MIASDTRQLGRPRRGTRRGRARAFTASALGVLLLLVAVPALSQDHGAPPPPPPPNGHQGPPPNGHQGPPPDGHHGQPPPHRPGEGAPPPLGDGPPPGHDDRTRPWMDEVRGQSVDEMIATLRESSEIRLPIEAGDPESAARWLLKIGESRRRLHQLREEIRRRGGAGPGQPGEAAAPGTPADARPSRDVERHRIAEEAQRIEREMRIQSLLAVIHADELRATIAGARAAGTGTPGLTGEVAERALGVLDESLQNPNLEQELRRALVHVKIVAAYDGAPGRPWGDRRRPGEGGEPGADRGWRGPRGDGQRDGPRDGQRDGGPSEGGRGRPGSRGDGRDDWRDGGSFGLRERLELIGEMRHRLATMESEIRELSEEIETLRAEVRALREAKDAAPPATAAESGTDGE